MTTINSRAWIWITLIGGGLTLWGLSSFISHFRREAALVAPAATDDGRACDIASARVRAKLKASSTPRRTDCSVAHYEKSIAYRGFTVTVTVDAQTDSGVMLRQQYVVDVRLYDGGWWEVDGMRMHDSNSWKPDAQHK
ncbi:MAG: hypothetical protein IPK81_06625 [Rhodospirillales bacterium]|nr:MAG: hypothetical protein IPK81_06625 [Rhodospirillales bacterium]